MSGIGEVWVQVTAGQGPVECAWAVLKVVDRLRADAASLAVRADTLSVVPGPQAGTALSVLLGLSGDSDSLAGLLAGWCGTVQVIAPSPFRAVCSRKNWFVGVAVLEAVEPTRFDARQVRWETMRASGPGGQHVNRTESAVRLTHLPTGLQVTASEERSQHRNRRLALARLEARLAGQYAERQGEARRQRWRAHHQLERGNPVRVLREAEA